MPIATRHLAGGGSINVYAGEDDKIYARYTADGRLCRDVEPEQLRQYVDQPTYIEAMPAHIEAMPALGEGAVTGIALPE